jgi:DNA invertase Pin-like site-specific DNA recombinase
MPAKASAASIDAVSIREMKAQGLGATQIAKALNIGAGIGYRALEGA